MGFLFWCRWILQTFPPLQVFRIAVSFHLSWYVCVGHTTSVRNLNRLGKEPYFLHYLKILFRLDIALLTWANIFGTISTPTEVSDHPQSDWHGFLVLVGDLLVSWVFLDFRFWGVSFSMRAFGIITICHVYRSWKHLFAPGHSLGWSFWKRYCNLCEDDFQPKEIQIVSTTHLWNCKLPVVWSTLKGTNIRPGWYNLDGSQKVGFIECSCS